MNVLVTLLIALAAPSMKDPTHHTDPRRVAQFIAVCLAERGEPIYYPTAHVLTCELPNL